MSELFESDIQDSTNPVGDNDVLENVEQTTNNSDEVDNLVQNTVEYIQNNQKQDFEMPFRTLLEVHGNQMLALTASFITEYVAIYIDLFEQSIKQYPNPNTAEFQHKNNELMFAKDILSAKLQFAERTNEINLYFSNAENNTNIDSN